MKQRFVHHGLRCGGAWLAGRGRFLPRLGAAHHDDGPFFPVSAVLSWAGHARHADRPPHFALRHADVVRYGIDFKYKTMTSAGGSNFQARNLMRRTKIRLENDALHFYIRMVRRASPARPLHSPPLGVSSLDLGRSYSERPFFFVRSPTPAAGRASANDLGSSYSAAACLRTVPGKSRVRSAARRVRARCNGSKPDVRSNVLSFI